MTLLNNTPKKEAPKKDALQTWREEVFNQLISVIGILGTIAFVVSAALTLFSEQVDYKYLTIYTVLYLFIAIAAFVKRLPTLARIYLFNITIFVVGALSTIEKAAVGDGRVWLFLSIFLAILFLGKKAGFTFTMLSVVYWAAIGILFNNGSLIYKPLNQFSFSIWGGTTATFLLTALATVISTGFLLSSLNKTIEESRSLAKKTTQQSKEIKLQRDRLDKQTTIQKMIAEINRQLAALLTKEDLLEKAPQLLGENLGFNNVSVFLMEHGETLRLASSNVWNEQVYTTRDYAISLYEDIIGLAIIEEQNYSNDETNVELKSIYPETQAYLILPLRGRKEILGALVLQSEQKNRFDEETKAILQVFSDQFALLIENASLLAKRESALEAERRAYGDIIHQAWGEFLDRGHAGAFRRDKYGIRSIAATPYQKKPLPQHKKQFPIRVRGRVIGYVEANKPENRAWTTSEKELFQTLTARLENALENARLYQISQEQARRERIVAETSSRMRETLSIEKVLETAALELRRAFGAEATEIWLEPDDEA